MRDDFIKYYAKCLDVFVETNKTLDNIQRACHTSADSGLVVDAILILKKSAQCVDQARKDINRALDILQRIACVHAAHTDANSLKGELGTGYGNASEQWLLPDREKEPETYAALMRAIGIPEEHVRNALIRPSFSGVSELATQLAEEGKPLPPGLEHVRRVPKFSFTVRPRVDLDELARKYLGVNDADSIDADNPF